MEVGRKKSSETKSLIIDESEKLFSERGFDATSIDHISKKVGITKAAIYYHFQNKQEILDSIIGNFVSESLAIQKHQNEVIESITAGGEAGPDIIAEMTEEMFVFLRSRVKTLRIILMESIKDTSSEAPIFFVMEKYFSACGEICLSCFYDTQKTGKTKIKVEQFFMKYIPLVTFVIFHEKWGEYQKLKKKEVMDTFREVYIQAFSFSVT